MVKVEILTTPGCVSCSKVEKMLDEMKVKYKVYDITEKPELLEKYKFYTAPGVVINGKLVFSGVPSLKDLKKALGR
jgi:glutaredoxin